MGIPLTRPEDVIVRDGRVFLKTIKGLLPIDVIYRRLEPANLDPVAFANVNETGIPGLVQCLRRGTVQVANAMGCAVADNRALLRHADAIVRFYSGRKALLPTVPTYHGYDLDQSDWIRDNLESLTLKAVCHPETLKRSNPQAGRLFEEGNLAKLMDGDPRLVVGQLIPESSRLPVVGREGQFSNPAEQLSGRMRSELIYTSIEEIIQEGLHAYIDRLQQRLIDLNNAILECYVFQPEIDLSREIEQQQQQQ